MAELVSGPLVLDRLSKSFANTAVVKDLSIQIEAGEFVALLGPSGCGKTTVLRMIAGFEAPDEGTITLAGECLSSPQIHRPPEQREMSMVFQSYALWPHKNVADNVGYALRLKKVPREEYQRRVQAALAAVNMQAFAERMPAQLSGGQRQRVALARCLIAEPKVVLLDEPLANLDRHLRDAMERNFREFHQRTAASFIYVTHDQAEAMALADKIAVMQTGRIVQFATPEVIYQQPATEWVARFIGQGSILYLYNHKSLYAADALVKSPGDGQAPTERLLIRPQHIRLLSSMAAKAQAHLPGSVIERVFKGERYQYRVALAGQQELSFYSEERFDLGQNLALSVEHSHALSA